MRRTIIGFLTIIMVSLGLVAGGLSATGANDSPARDRGKGFTRVAIAPAVAELVTSAGISVSPVGEASAFAYRGTVALRFPIKGVVDGTRIKHVGGVALESKQSRLVLKRFRINLNQSSVSALVNNAVRVEVFNLHSSGRPKLGNVRLDLTRKGAKALNNFFLPDPFAGGDTFGFARVFAK